MVVDQLGVRNIDVQHPTAQTYARLAAAGVKVNSGRIVDLALAGTRYDVMSAALGVLRSAPEFDLVVAVAGSSARFSPDLAVRPILDSATQSPECSETNPVSLCWARQPRRRKTAATKCFAKYSLEAYRFWFVKM